MEKVKKGRPFGFYVCALGFTFERLAFYTMKYLLAIWIATEVASGGLGLSDIEASVRFFCGLFVHYASFWRLHCGSLDQPENLRTVRNDSYGPRIPLYMEGRFSDAGMGDDYSGGSRHRTVQGESVRYQRSAVP